MLPPSLSILPPGAQILFLEQSGGNPWDFRQESWSNPAECHPQRAGHMEETRAPGLCRPPHPGQVTAATAPPWAAPGGVRAWPPASHPNPGVGPGPSHGAQAPPCRTLSVVSLLVLPLYPHPMLSPGTPSPYSLLLWPGLCQEEDPDPALRRPELTRRMGRKVGPWVWPLLPHLLHPNSGLWPLCALPGT